MNKKRTQETAFKIIDGTKYIWNVETLINTSRDLEVIKVELANIKELHEVFWFRSSRERPTIFNTVEHMKRVINADLSYPVILAPDGSLLDGGHRVAKALLEDKKTIDAVQLKEYPKPDVTFSGGSLTIGKPAQSVKVEKNNIYK